MCTAAVVTLFLSLSLSLLLLSRLQLLIISILLFMMFPALFDFLSSLPPLLLQHPQLDTDGDGAISPEEATDRLDIDGDGQLNATEESHDFQSFAANVFDEVRKRISDTDMLSLCLDLQTTALSSCRLSVTSKVLKAGNKLKRRTSKSRPTTKRFSS